MGLLLSLSWDWKGFSSQEYILHFSYFRHSIGMVKTSVHMYIYLYFNFVQTRWPRCKCCANVNRRKCTQFMHVAWDQCSTVQCDITRLGLYLTLNTCGPFLYSQ